jgi:hypothetical protein
MMLEYVRLFSQPFSDYLMMLFKVLVSFSQTLIAMCLPYICGFFISVEETTDVASLCTKRKYMFVGSKMKYFARLDEKHSS